MVVGGRLGEECISRDVVGAGAVDAVLFPKTVCGHSLG